MAKTRNVINMLIAKMPMDLNRIDSWHNEMFIPYSEVVFGENTSPAASVKIFYQQEEHEVLFCFTYYVYDEEKKRFEADIMKMMLFADNYHDEIFISNNGRISKGNLLFEHHKLDSDWLSGKILAMAANNKFLTSLDKMADDYHPNNSDADNLYCWGA